MSATIPIVSLDALDQIVQTEPMVVLKFGASWCGPCKVLDPIVSDLAVEMPRVHFVAVDAEQTPGLIRRYNINGLPTLQLIKDGQPVAQLIGAKPAPAVREFICTHFNLR